MTPYPGYIDQIGQTSAMSAGGVGWWWEAGQLYVSDLAAAQAIVAAYNPVPTMQAAAIAAVEAHYAGLIAAGWVYQGVTVGITPADAQNIGAMATTAMVTLQAQSFGITVQPWPSNFAWLPQGAGAALPLTAQEMIAFGAAVSHYVSGLILYADALAAAIMAATTAAAVEAINPAAGWPTS